MAFFRLGAMVQTGAAAALSQVMVLVTMPIASRLFDQSAFGVLGLMVAIANILAIVPHLGYSEAVMAAEDDHEADALVVGVVAISIVSAVPIALLAWIAIRFDVLGYGELPAWSIGLIVVEAISITLTFLFQQRAIRAQQYRVLASSHLVLGGARSIGQVATGLAFANAFGLALSEVVSRVATAALMIWKAPPTLLRPPFDRAQIGAVLKRFGSFAAMRAMATLLNSVNLALPILIISRHFSLAEVGALTFTLSILYAPLGFVQKSIGDVFVGTYLSLLQTDKRQAKRTILQTFWLLLAIATAGAAVLYFAGIQLFTFIFGSHWALAGQTAEVFAPAILLMIVITPLSSSLNVLRRPDIPVVFNLMRLAGLAGVLMIAGPWSSDYLTAVETIVAVLCLTYVVYGVLILRTNAAALTSDAR